MKVAADFRLFFVHRDDWFNRAFVFAHKGKDLRKITPLRRQKMLFAQWEVDNWNRRRYKSVSYEK